ncbi:secreted antigen 1 [Babesia divergens]|uniref:Secreted antigen 1 n=1 Tax=Babesia divergens TaxID=32595 RepID=A0AAD9GCZ9_BABDI|nr:secreted antigen 1 [Babesia divergens]
MKLLGILRASTLFTLLSAFHGQPVSCGIFNWFGSSKKSSNANQSENSEGDLAAQVKMLQEKLQALEAGLDKAPKEPSTDNMAESMVESPLVEEAEDSTVMSQDAVPEDRKKPHGPSDFSNEFNSEYEEKEPIKEAEKSNEEYEQHHVARKTETDVTSDPSTINLPDGSNNPNGSMATPSSNGAAEPEKLMKEIAEERKELVERLSKSDVPYSLEDMTFFYGMLKDGEYVDPEALQKIGEKIHTFLGNFGIHGEDAKASLAIFMEMIQEYVMGLLSSTKQLSNEERAEMRKTVAEILEQLPKSHVNTQANDYDGKEDSFDERSIVDMPEISENPKEFIVESPLVEDDGDIPGKSPRKRDHDLLGELNVESPKELEEYDELNGGLVHKSKFRKAGKDLFEHHSTVEVSEISENHEDSTVESSSQPYAPAPKSNLVFQSSAWDDSQLASAVLFIKEFCKDLGKDKFKGYAAGINYTSSKCLCSKVLNILEPITRFYSPTYGPGSVAEERKEIPGNMYEGQLESEKFDVYTKWLVENLPVITDSLKRMIEESAKLTEEQLKTDTSVGPLKYGFLYKGNNWNRIVRMHIKDLLNGLTGYFKSLYIALGNDLSGTHWEESYSMKSILGFFGRGKKSDVNPHHEVSDANREAVEEPSCSDYIIEPTEILDGFPMESEEAAHKETKETL